MSLAKQCKVHQPCMNFRAGAEIKTLWFIILHFYPVINHIFLCFHPFTFRSCFPSSPFSVILSLLHLGLLLLLHFNLIASFTVFLLSSISSQLLFVFWCSQRVALCSLQLAHLHRARLLPPFTPHAPSSLLKCTCPLMLFHLPSCSTYFRSDTHFLSPFPLHPLVFPSISFNHFFFTVFFFSSFSSSSSHFHPSLCYSTSQHWLDIEVNPR